MSHTERLRRSPDAFRQLTGITPVVFDQSLADLAPHTSKPRPNAKTALADGASPVPGASTP